MSKPTIAAIVIGIDNWEKYTLPLIRSISLHEPDCLVTVIDNASNEPYPYAPIVEGNQHYLLERTERLCYSAAINAGKELSNKADWYIVLSNDVLCTGPFADMLAGYSDDTVVGPLLKQIHLERVGNVDYIEGWCVAASRRVWDTLGGWDEGMKISSYEDCDFSHRARKAGFWLEENPDLPFTHLDQRQRFTIVPNYWDSENHNVRYFMQKHGVKG